MIRRRVDWPKRMLAGPGRRGVQALIPTTFTPPKCGFTPPNGYNFYSSVRTCATIHIHFRVFSGHYSDIGATAGSSPAPFPLSERPEPFTVKLSPVTERRSQDSDCTYCSRASVFRQKKEKTRTYDGLRLPRRDGDHGIRGCLSAVSRAGSSFGQGREHLNGEFIFFFPVQLLIAFSFSHWIQGALYCLTRKLLAKAFCINSFE